MCGKKWKVPQNISKEMAGSRREGTFSVVCPDFLCVRPIVRVLVFWYFPSLVYFKGGRLHPWPGGFAALVAKGKHTRVKKLKENTSSSGNMITSS